MREWVSEWRGTRPDEGFGRERFAATVEEEGVGAVGEGLVGVVVDGGIDRSQ